MPPKSQKSKAAIKAEINEKVRDIRIKQQKWLEQRDTSLRTASANGNANKSEEKKSSLVSSQQSHTRIGRISPSKPSTSTSVTTAQSPAPTHGFHSWRANRQKASPAPENLLDNVELRLSDASTIADSCTIDGLGSEAGSVYHGGESDRTLSHGVVTPLQLPQSDHAGYDYLKVQHSDRSLPPAQFDALADEIVHRVKRELHLQGQHPELGAEGQDASRAGWSEEHPGDRGKSEQAGVERQASSRAGVERQASSRAGVERQASSRAGVERQASSRAGVEQGSKQNISSHQCPVCRKLMTGACCQPLLLIPCGHTACKSCVASPPATCPVCHLTVQSATPNIMLHQIITDYHHSQPITAKDQPRREPITAQQAEAHTQAKTYAQIPTKTASDYEEDYRNLLLRCDVLREEEAAILSKMAAVEREKSSQQDQMDHISAAQERLRDQIRGLEGDIAELDGHKQGYRDKLVTLDVEKNKERRRLEMVRTTVSQLNTDINKIKRELKEL